ncbi:MAG: protein-disulfide reductase DsbD family protein [Alphaproteobacteria bacterium]
MLRLAGFLAALLAVVLAAAAHADPVSTEHVRARLITEWESLPPGGGTFSVALEQKIIPGWHTYWRNPGDSGEPTNIDWELPEGFEAGEIEWPAPRRLPFQSLVNFGFEDTVIFPMEITAPSGLTPGETVRLKADVRWLVCEEICIPEEVTLTLALPVREGPPAINEEGRRTIEAARASLPRPGGWDAVFDGTSEYLRIAIEAPQLLPAFETGRVTEVAFFPYEDGVIVNAAEQETSVHDGRVVLSLEPGFLFTQNGMSAPEELAGVLVVRERSEGGGTLETAFEIAASPGDVAAPPESAIASVPLWQALLYAAIGGLILNLMPCVFPVIFLKALGFVSLAKEAPQKVRLHGLLYAAGVVGTFAALGSLLFALRASGAEVGWGFQLQSPVVVGALIYLMFIIGLNLSGVFNVGTSLQGVGGSLAEMRGPAGAFFTGVLATVVAAPCTAPFMALALGTAMTLPPSTGLGVFLALGAGMALPYLVFSFAPALAARLPRPGPWMERLKQVLAFPLYLTAVWLLWVLARQNVGADGIGFILAGLVLVAFAAWLLHTRSTLASRGWRTAMAVLAVVTFAGAGGALTLLQGGAPQPASGTTDIMAAEPRLPYEDFSQARLDAALKTERPVFLNFTAAWCITCHWNDANALSADSVANKFEAMDVLYLRGDWTNRDPEITRVLERFGRAGVPLYVYYGPPVDGRRPEPVVLPPLLSESIVLGVLDGD